MSPGRITALASNTVRDAVRNKVLYILLFFAIIMIATSVLLATLSYVERERILQDVGFSAVRLFGAAIAIFIGVGLIHREVDRRTVYTILSKPVTRAEFLLGKYAGLVATVWLMMGIMSVAFVGVSLAAGAPLTAGHGVALAMAAVEAALIVSIATLFSSFSTPLLASCYSAGFYVVGHLTRDLRALGEASESPAAAEATRWIHRTLPDLSSFNWTLEAVHGLPIPAGDVAAAFAMGAAWCALFLLVAVVTFERRDFR